MEIKRHYDGKSLPVDQCQDGQKSFALAYAIGAFPARRWPVIANR